MIHLVVNEPFENFKRGSIITDPAEVQRVLFGENRHCVVRRIAQPGHEKFFKTNKELAANSKSVKFVAQSRVPEVEDKK